MGDVVTLAEDLYLLACDDKTGRPRVERAHLDLGLGGALLLDLATRHRAALSDGRVITTAGSTGEPLLDDVVAELARAGSGHGADFWVRHLSRGAHRAVRDRLIDVGVLRGDDHRFLRVIPLRRTRETDGRLHHELVGHLREAVELGHSASPETSALALLALAIGLDPHLFPRSDPQAVRGRMRELAAACVDGMWVAAAVAAEVNAVDAARGITGGAAALP